MIIYLITNTVNGKQYVGQTIRTLNDRLKEHRRNTNSLIGRAFKKYGKGSFEVEILHQTDDYEKLQELEMLEISTRNTITPDGYNLALGGEGTKGYKHSEKSKDKMSKIKKESYRGNGNPFFGKTHTEETKKHLSEIRKGKYVHEGREVNFRKVKVCNLSTGEVFNSVKEAAASCGAKPTHITRVCKGKRKSTRGYVWGYL